MSTPLTWEAVEDKVLDLLIIAFECGFAAGCGRPAALPDDVAPLMGEVRRRWEEVQESWIVQSRALGDYPVPPSEIPDWLRVLTGDLP